MQADELLTNEGYLLKNIQLDLFNAINDYLELNNISQTDFAKKLGVSKGYVSQILNGRFDHKLSKLVELSIAIGKVPIVLFKDVSAVLAEAETYDTLELKQLVWDEMHKEETKPNLSELFFNQNFSVSQQTNHYEFA